MNIQLKGTNYEIPGEVKAMVEQKLNAIKKILGDREASALAEVEIQLVEEGKNNNHIYRAELNLSVDGELYRGESTRRSLGNAVSDVKQEVLKELRRAKDKNNSMVKRGGRFIKSALRGFRR